MPEEQEGQSVITSALLDNEQTPDFETSQEQSPFPISALSPIEQQTQDVFDKLQDLNKGLEGESAFKTEQEDKFGVEGFTQTQKDLQTQLNNLIRESQAIPLQVSEESLGRGRTTGAVTGISQSRLRQNAIKALTTSSLLEATQGNLKTAQELADRAVSEKFDPIREKLDVNLRNLELIMQSPAFTRAQKDRAEKRQIQQQRELRKLEKEEEAESQKTSGFISLLQTNPEISQSDISVLQEIAQNSDKSLIDLFTKAQELGMITQESNDSSAVAEYKFYAKQEKIAGRTPVSFNEYQTLDANRKASIARAAAGTMSFSDRFNAERSLANSFDQNAKGAREAIIQIGLINSALGQAKSADAEGKSLNAASQGVLVAFQKMIDPTSVVRESEYARSGNGQSLIQRMEGMALRLQQGGAGVTIEGLEEFVETANVFLQGYQNSLIDQAERTQFQANSYGLDINNILRPSDIDLLSGIEGGQGTVLGVQTSTPEGAQQFIDSVTTNNAEAASIVNSLSGNLSIFELAEYLKDKGFTQ